MQVLLVRGANGVVVWRRETVNTFDWQWKCTRDQFVIQRAADDSQLEPTLVALAQHSAGLVGAISQVVEIDV